jgi:molybdopterin synthase catalytic subunit
MSVKDSDLVTPSTEKKLAAIENLAKLLDSPEVIQKKIQKIVREEKETFRKIKRSPVVVGEFYELGIIEHSQSVTFLGLMLAHRNDALDMPQDKVEEFKALEVEFSKFLEQEDEKELVSKLFGGY